MAEKFQFLSMTDYRQTRDYKQTHQSQKSSKTIVHWTKKYRSWARNKLKLILKLAQNGLILVSTLTQDRLQISPKIDQNLGKIWPKIDPNKIPSLQKTHS
jgi:hypothetical protein